jgi:hypothetical protein
LTFDPPTVWPKHTLPYSLSQEKTNHKKRPSLMARSTVESPLSHEKFFLTFFAPPYKRKILFA